MNAGALWWKDVIDTPAERYDLINEVNSRAAFLAAHYCMPHFVAQETQSHVINMSPPIDTRLLRGKTAYCISKFGMTLGAMGIAAEGKETGVAGAALWPATLVESQATINHKIGERSMWRKASVLSDACLAILSLPPEQVSGRALIDEEVLREHDADVDMAAYRCDPNVEPPTMAELERAVTHGAGKPSERA